MTQKFPNFKLPTKLPVEEKKEETPKKEEKKEK